MLQHKTFRKKNTKILLFFMLFIFVGSLPFIAWSFQRTTYLNAAILDKTVPEASYREHKGLAWTLNNMKYFNKMDKHEFSYDKDYYGFSPLSYEQYDVRDLPKDLGDTDLIYIADTYGVYNGDFYKNNLNEDPAGLIYGGTTLEEIKTIENSKNDNTIICEFNSLASPTSDEVRDRMQSFFGIKWGGWIGRYFIDLSREGKEIPSWVINNYEMKNNKRWDYSGAGFILINIDSTVIILKEGTESGGNINKVDFDDDYLAGSQIKDNVNYYYWFEILDTDSDVEVIARYNLDLTDSGKKLLDKYGLKGSFPAVVKKMSKTGELNHTLYYFAGDYVDISKIPEFSRVWGMDKLCKVITPDVAGVQDHFFWNVYYPMMTKILNDIKTIQR